MFGFFIWVGVMAGEGLSKSLLTVNDFHILVSASFLGGALPPLCPPGFCTTVVVSETNSRTYRSYCMSNVLRELLLFFSTSL